MLSVTGDDGSLGYLSHARARTADNLFWRHHVSPTRAGGWGAPHLGGPFNASIIAENDTAFAPLASDRPKDLGSAVHGMPAVQPLRLRRRSREPSPVSELAPWERVLSE
jgi:hypothetical protein